MKTQREKIVFIVNPKSGIKSHRNIDEVIKKHIDGKRFDAIVEYTQYAHHATEIAKNHHENGIKKFVAVGGDGTVNQVVAALCHTDATLGIIPLGSGNGFARHLKIPIKPEKAVRLINRDNIKLVDVALFNDQPFVCTSGLGFDAYVAHLFSQHTRRGFWSYIITTVKAFRTYKPKRLKIRIDSQLIDKELFLITVANAKQYGNNGYIAPNADVSDGLMDVTLMSAFPWYVSPIIAFRLFTQRIAHSRYVETYRTRELTLEYDSIELFHYDGEPITVEGTLRFTISPLALKVLIP